MLFTIHCKKLYLECINLIAVVNENVWMKYLSILFLFFLSFDLFAQNALFIPFGQTMSEVDTFLESKDYLKTIDRSEDDLIHVVVYDGRTIDYHFKDGFLFGIEETREFYNHKLKEGLVKECMDFLKGTEEKVKTLKTEGVDSHYAVAPTDRVLEFMVKESGRRKRKQLIMTIKSTSRYHGPRLRTEEYVSQLVD